MTTLYTSNSSLTCNLPLKKQVIQINYYNYMPNEIQTFQHDNNNAVISFISLLCGIFLFICSNFYMNTGGTPKLEQSC